MWQSDAHIQDRLAALSERAAIGYQWGCGLADTYWALDSAQQADAGWGFLLGERRCGELSRLTGRLAEYMGEYTASAIALSPRGVAGRGQHPRPGWKGDADQPSPVQPDPPLVRASNTLNEARPQPAHYA